MATYTPAVHIDRAKNHIFGYIEERGSGIPVFLSNGYNHGYSSWSARSMNNVRYSSAVSIKNGEYVFQHKSDIIQTLNYIVYAIKGNTILTSDGIKTLDLPKGAEVSITIPSISPSDAKSKYVQAECGTVVKVGDRLMGVMSIMARPSLPEVTGYRYASRMDSTPTIPIHNDFDPNVWYEFNGKKYIMKKYHPLFPEVAVIMEAEDDSEDIVRHINQLRPTNQTTPPSKVSNR